MLTGKYKGKTFTEIYAQADCLQLWRWIPDLSDVQDPQYCRWACDIALRAPETSSEACQNAPRIGLRTGEKTTDSLKIFAAFVQHRPKLPARVSNGAATRPGGF